jgi:PHD/YefM family antitoxin component YafN of YafNO toxin-antitoxin module
MYLRRVDGLRTVTLPDGSVMTRADLPPGNTRRWVASRKAAVVLAVQHGLITHNEALNAYALSAEEFESWQSAVQAHGTEGLKVTTLRKLRQH